jgi:hypothetical protein
MIYREIETLNKRKLLFELTGDGGIQISSGDSVSKLRLGVANTTGFQSCKSDPGSLLLPITNMIFEEQFRQVFTENVGEIPQSLILMKEDDGSGNSLTGLAAFLLILIVPAAICCYMDVQRTKERNRLQAAQAEEESETRRREHEVTRMAEADAAQIKLYEAVYGPRVDPPKVCLAFHLLPKRKSHNHLLFCSFILYICFFAQ